MGLYKLTKSIKLEDVYTDYTKVDKLDADFEQINSELDAYICNNDDDSGTAPMVKINKQFAIKSGSTDNYNHPLYNKDTIIVELEDESANALGLDSEIDIDLFIFTM